MAEDVRLIHPDELDQLLDLYRLLHPEDPDARKRADLGQLWADICSDRSLFYPVVEVDGKIVSSCTLAVIKNLTRDLRPYGVIENVVTHPDFRKRGYATRALHKAEEIAREQGCYKVMLLTGSKDPATLRFYEKAGFLPGVKTGYILIL